MKRKKTKTPVANVGVRLAAHLRSDASTDETVFYNKADRRVLRRLIMSTSSVDLKLAEQREAQADIRAEAGNSHRARRLLERARRGR